MSLLAVALASLRHILARECLHWATLMSALAKWHRMDQPYGKDGGPGDNPPTSLADVPRIAVEIGAKGSDGET